jgi:hypothetical protein
LYLDVDVGRFEPAIADRAQWETVWNWRKGMNAALGTPQKPPRKALEEKQP